jgi:PAS domain-containing protein
MHAETFSSTLADADMAQSVVPWVMTDPHGMLLESNRAAARLLNLSVTGLRNRQLLLFFDGDREQWRQALRSAAAGLMVDREGAVRPRDRRPIRVRAEIVKTRDRSGNDAVLWTFVDLDAENRFGSDAAA